MGIAGYMLEVLNEHDKMFSSFLPAQKFTKIDSLRGEIHSILASFDTHIDGLEVNTSLCLDPRYDIPNRWDVGSKIGFRMKNAACEYMELA